MEYKAPPKAGKRIPLARHGTLTEAQIERPFNKFCRERDIIYEKFTAPNKRGVPDRILTLPFGLIVFIEFKAPGNVPTTTQHRDHEKRRDSGVLVYVIDDQNVGEWLIEKLLRVDQDVENGHLDSLLYEKVKNRNEYAKSRAVTRIPK